MEKNKINFETLQIHAEIYLGNKNENDRNLFGFEEVSEYFCGRLYKYAIGIVNLQRLYALREQLRNTDVFIVNTGRKGIN